MNEKLLLVETSGRAGFVAVAQGLALRAVRRLDEARRHARDLAPAVKDLLAAQGWKPGDLHGVLVSRGPGSYTGLRVGLMSAKTLAYATGCALVAVETLAVIARQAPAQAERLAVLADAQQGKVYVQHFLHGEPASSLAIRPFADWLAEAEADTWITGPGIRGHETELADRKLVAPERWDPLPESLLVLGLERLRRGQRDDPFAVEPLYLRPSAAEEKLRRSTDET